jgi:tRNA (guanine-N7-)-methyltransferase
VPIGDDFAGEPDGAGAPRLRTIRSFVRREGRITPAQKYALESLWPRYGLEFDGGSSLDLAQAFGRTAALAVEIGFGSGAHLAALAQERPQTDFLGIEVHRPGVGRLLQELAAAGLNNVRVICADAVEVLRSGLAAQSVDQFFILFPDPWPKKRHHKRRLIQPEFVGLLVRALRSGGHLHLATDWAEYAQHMLAVLEAEPQLRSTSPGGFAPRPEWRPTTRFEARGLRAGHPSLDLDYQRL